jgi:hypothetical protein
MTNWTPHDLPFLLAGHAEAAEAEGAMLVSVFNSTMVDEVRQDVGEDVESVAGLTARYERDAKIGRTATLSWMSADVCELIRESAQSVPEWSPTAAIPHPCGVIAFEDYIMACPEDAGEGAAPVSVDALGWILDDGVVHVTALSRRKGASRELVENKLVQLLHMAVVGHKPGKQPESHIHEMFDLHLDPDRPQGGNTPVAVESRVSDGYGEADREAYASAAEELLRILGATWLLMGQPRVVEEDVPAEVTVRTADRTGAGPAVRKKQRVRVSVRRLTQQARASHGAGRRSATSRWWVRGHWRQQAWGEGRKLRKPVYIEPHTAGAKDADDPTEDTRPSVQIWRK